MQNAIKQEIKRLSRRAFHRRTAEQKTKIKYQKKYEKRTGNTAGTPRPTSYSYVHPQFDPEHCARNSNSLAKTIWHKIINGTYKPVPAIRYSIPKPNGGERIIMEFSIPDAAVANILLRRAQRRNLKKISPYSFAYHPDKNIFDAIINLKKLFHDGKIFSVQVDFKNYFENIPTGYIDECIDKKELISLTPHEKHILYVFLRHRYSSYSTYRFGTFQRRTKGTPQGSSISLLLANLANHGLDVRLEHRSGGFVRFADDVTAICDSYDEAQRIENAFIDHCRESGLIINEEKSDGIGIIKSKPAELRTYSHIDYLGYRFMNGKLTIPDSVKKRIKIKISNLVFIYLLKYPERGEFSMIRRGVSPDFDWDLLGLIAEIRRYLYGGLTEHEIRSYLAGGTNKLGRMRGLMGFYALIEDREPLRELDGWLKNSVERAMIKRNHILQAGFRSRGPLPRGSGLLLGDWLDVSAWRGGPPYPERRFPSFVRGWRAARKYYFTFGLENVEPPKYFSYYK